jgi:hypothetical protein
MGKNTGNSSRIGSVKGRTQTKTASGHSVKRDAKTGRFLEVKTSSKSKFKGVPVETDKRRS